MISSRSPAVDWEPLLKRLTSAAYGLFKQYGLSDVLRGGGISADDLAVDALIEFFEGKTVKWSPQQPNEDPFPLIWIVMRNNLIDRIRKPGHQKTVLIEDVRKQDGTNQLESVTLFDSGLPNLLKRPGVGFTDAEARILAETFYPYAEGDQALIDVIVAVVYFQCRKRREIAECLDITPEDVTDRWEKLKYNYTRH